MIVSIGLSTGLMVCRSGSAQSQTSIVAKCAPGAVLRCHHPIQRIGPMYSVILESLDQSSVESHA